MTCVQPPLCGLSEVYSNDFTHHSISGCTDHFAGTELEGLEITRRVMATLNIKKNSVQPPGEYYSLCYLFVILLKMIVIQVIQYC